MISQMPIDKSFIIVYERFTEPIAQSLYNRAIEKGITCTAWSEKEYIANKVRLTNKNFILLLNSDLIKKNLADPILEYREIVKGVLYKKQGHQIGIFLDKNQNPIKAADLLAGVFKENWGKAVITLIAAGLAGVSVLSTVLYISKSKRAKFYLYMKAIDKFDKDLLNQYIQDEL